jgi:hypothetical protein
LLKQLLDAVEEPSLVGMMLRALEVWLQRHRGEVAKAVKGLRALRADAGEVGDLQLLALVTADLALACIWEVVGEEGELDAILEEMLDFGAQGMGTGSLALSIQSVQRAREGEPKAARRLLAEAHERADEQGEFMVWEPYLSWAGAHLAMIEGQWPEALAAFEATVATFDRRNDRWYRVRTLIDWAGAHLARGESGDRERALELLREAEAEFEAMGAHGYVERVRGRLEELGAGSSMA